MAGGDASRAIMVGDSRVDVATARAAGVPVIAVSFGYADAPAREFEADAVIDHYSELEPAVADLLGTAIHA
jgi:phosphoglycolate phosphatase